MTASQCAWAMSALGQSRPVEGPPVAGACPLRSESGQDSRRLSTSALCQKRTFALHQSALFDHLVGAQQCCSGHFEAKRLGGLKIEDELEFRCPLDRKIGGIGALENFVHE